MYIQERTMCKTPYIKIDNRAGIPKYKQLMNAITNGIRKKTLKVGDRIPSINHISEEYGLARSTVEKAYVNLRNQKIINSIKGKGFYIARTDLQIKKNILFLVNRIDSFSLHFFNAFTDVLGEEVKVDLEIYGEDSNLFKEILYKKESDYDYLAIFAKFKTNTGNNNKITEEILETISTLPKHKLILLDQKINQFQGQAHQVYQDFQNNFYKVLMNGLPNFKEYQKLILIHSDTDLSSYSNDLKIGFKRFCARYKLDCEIINKVGSNTSLESKNLYLAFKESDLIELLKKAKKENYQLGRDIGIVSYRDTPLKRYLGISIIETNIKKMVNSASDMLSQKIAQTIRIDFEFTYRTSS